MQEKNDYYVYVFKRKDSDVVFYVGSGRLNRVNQKQSRNKECSEIMNTVGYYYEFIREGLSKQEAREIEEDYIKNPLDRWELTNKHLPSVGTELDYEELSKIFYYDESSPTCLRYNKDITKNKGAIIYRKGDVAGNPHYRGNKLITYRMKVTINGSTKTLKVHRVVWCLVHGSIDPHLVVDHIDNDPSNNKVSNLRLVEQRVNGRNKTIARIPNTGIPGITIKNGQYKAELRDCKGVKKSFSINKYGEEKALYLAAKARYEYLVSQPEHLKFSDTHSCLEELIKIITNFENKVNYEFDDTILPSGQFRVTEGQGGS